MRYRTDTRALVLAVLAEEPLHGYGISKAIKARSSKVLKMGEGQLYPILHELEERGWVTAEWEMQDEDPPRRVYSITEEGGGELKRRSKEWETFVSAVGTVLQPPPRRTLEPGHE
ncbi:MAG: helix-turn-helix transcriptional regulator [Fimbriimonadaceae bacterium]|nr:helix-turn-helix transcriptional regulator [Chthonomonadaceae bacterium]MCO5297230.1 helix-turn-helix transcriptional regulator [Fimbriimonadaceae bacterium]